MHEILLILAGTILINNFVLVNFLGLCPFMGVSGKLDTALGMGLATTFVLTLASVASYSFNTCLLYTSPSPRDATLSRMPSSA